MYCVCELPRRVIRPDLPNNVASVEKHPITKLIYGYTIIRKEVARGSQSRGCSAYQRPSRVGFSECECSAVLQPFEPFTLAAES